MLVVAYKVSSRKHGSHKDNTIGTIISYSLTSAIVRDALYFISSDQRIHVDTEISGGIYSPRDETEKRCGDRHFNLAPMSFPRIESHLERRSKT